MIMLHESLLPGAGQALPTNSMQNGGRKNTKSKVPTASNLCSRISQQALLLAIACANVSSLNLKIKKLPIYQGSRGCALTQRNGQPSPPCTLPLLHHAYEGFITDQDCENTNVDFAVTPSNTDESTFLFSNPPSFDICGTLSFILNPDRNGHVMSFQVVERNSGASDSFQMLVAPINTPPIFSLIPYLDVYQGSEAWQGQIAFDISAGSSQGAWNESNQRISFYILDGDSALFAVSPYLQFSGFSLTLSFSVARFATGNTTLNVYAVDDGGTAQGGINRSLPKPLVISVVPWNHPPSFAIPAENATVTVQEGIMDFVIPAFARNITPGPPDEACWPAAAAIAPCRAQQLSFVIDFVDREELFLAPPALSPDGTLLLRLVPLPVGVAARVWLHLEDDGGVTPPPLRPPAGPPGSAPPPWQPPPQEVSNRSPTAGFTVVQVLRGNRSVGFSLAADAMCTLEPGAPCDCSPLLYPHAAPPTGTACRPLGAEGGVARVTVDEAASAAGAAYTVPGFASHLTTAQPYEPSAVTIFTRARSNGDVRYQGRARDPLRAAAGMEYVAGVAVSPDGAHVYGAEPETSSVVAFRCVGAPCRANGTAGLDFLERRAGGEQRVRFRGWNTTRPFEDAPITMASPAITEWSTFTAAGLTLAAAAAGGEPLRALVRGSGPLGPDPPPPSLFTAPVPGVGDSLWGRTAAMWTFDPASILSPAGLSEASLSARFPTAQPFLVQGVDNTTGAPMLYSLTNLVSPSFACGPDGCSYARPRAGLNPDADRLRQPEPWSTDFAALANATTVPLQCVEAYPTLATKATIRDRAGAAGPLVLAGPACKAAAGANPAVANDWDIPPALQLDLLTFAETNLAANAMQFDGVLQPGLTLAANLDDLVDGRTATSRLPLDSLSAEVWLTVRADPWVPLPGNTAGPRRGVMGVEAYLTYDLAKAFDSRFGTSALGSGFCAKGWSLSYFHTTVATTFEFHVFTEGLVSSDMTLISTSGNAEQLRQAAPWNLVYTVEPAVQQGEWQHLVVTYNGSHLQLFLNGRGSPLKRACSAARGQSCGRILYPAAYAFAADQAGQPLGVPTASSPQMCIQNASYPFMIGGYRNGMRGITTKQWLNYLASQPPAAYSYAFADDNMTALPHIGDVLMVRLYNISLLLENVLVQYAQRASILASNSLSAPDYWAVAEFGGTTEPNNPNIDFSSLYIQSPMTVRGFFNQLKNYQCLWQSLDGANTATTAASVSEDSLSLSCVTPLWRYGVRITVFSILDSSSFEYGQTSAQWNYDIGNTSSFSVATSQNVWMKVCLDKSCLFPTSVLSRTNWYWGQATMDSSKSTLTNNIYAIPKLFRFVASSSLFVFSSLQLARGKSPVGDIIIESPGLFYPVGDLRIFNSSGSMFLGKFEVDRNTGSIFKTSILNGGVGYDSGGTVVPCYSDSLEQMDGSISAVTVEEGGDSFISGRWEIDGRPFGATTNASGIFDANSSTTGSIVLNSFRFISHGSGYSSSTYILSNVQLYYPNSQVVQIGSISKVTLNELAYTDIGLYDQLSAAVHTLAQCTTSSCLQALAYCAPMTLGCSGQGFIGVCSFSTIPLSLSVQIVNNGQGYNRTAKPIIACGPFKLSNPTDVATYQDLLLASIPGGSRLSAKIAHGAVLRFSTINDFPLKLVQEFGSSHEGIWNYSSDWCNGPLSIAASSLLPFSVTDDTSYLILANFWDGLYGNRDILVKSGHYKSPPQQSILFQFDPETKSLCARQIVLNSSAQRWSYFTFQGEHYLAAAIFISQSDDGSLSTTAWSAIFHFTPDTHSTSGGTCISQMNTCSLTFAKELIDLENSSTFSTRGATAVVTFQMNSTEMSAQIMLFVVANYYDSDNATFNTPSLIYMLGKPVTDVSSNFSASGINYWKRCTDTLKVCSLDSDCQIHKCNRKCITSQRGTDVSRTCVCSNSDTECTSDLVCNEGITCKFAYTPAPAESHEYCWADKNLRYRGKDPLNRVTMCKIQELNTFAAQNVAYVAQNQKHFLAFSSDLENVAPQLFFADDGFPLFQRLPSVEAHGAQNIVFFRSAAFHNLYMLAAQSALLESLMFEFNGTLFQNISDLLFLPPQSSGGGQSLPFSFARSIAYFSGEQLIKHNILNTNNDFILVGGGYADGYVLDGLTNIYVGLAEETFLDIPSTILVSPDGLNVYVSNVFSGSIFGFSRDNVTGLLYASNTTSYFSARRAQANLGVFEANPLQPILPREAFAMAMSGDGQNIYVLGIFDNAVHTFLRDSASGTLSFLGTILDQMDSSMKLLEPRAITVSTNGMYIYVAASEFESIVTFHRSSMDGTLTFADSFWNGERSISSMNTTISSASTAPFVLGKSKPYAGNACASKQFAMRGKQYLAVAASNAPCFVEQTACKKDDSAGDESSTVAIYVWNITSGLFEMLQDIETERSVIDVEYFEISNSSYIAVANIYEGTHIYVFDFLTKSFNFHHELPIPFLPFDGNNLSCVCDSPEYRTSQCGVCFDDGDIHTDIPCLSLDAASRCALVRLPLVPRSLNFFSTPVGKIAISGSYLAVAYFSAANTSRYGGVFSIIYRWNENPVIGSEGLISWSSKFVVMQAIPTFGALIVDTITVNHSNFGPIQILSFANNAHNKEHNLSIYVLRQTARLTQPNATTQWESLLYGSSSEYSRDVADVYFEILKSFPAIGVSALKFFSVPACASFFVFASKNASMSWLTFQRWTADAFVEIQILDGDEALGVSNFEFFTATDGESYLAVAQSSCFKECSRSAILQYNKRMLIFGDLLSITDETNMFLRGKIVFPDDILHHKQALRIAAGKVMMWTAVNIGIQTFLIASSISLGAVQYLFSFKTAYGLNGISALSINPDDTYLYGASEVGHNLLVLGTKGTFDSKGQLISLLSFDGTFLNQNGLVGIESADVEVWNCGGFSKTDTAYFADGEVCDVIQFRNIVPRDSLPCSTFPPIPYHALIHKPTAECQVLSFSTLINESESKIFDANPSFDVIPHIISEGGNQGTLTFNLKSGQAGLTSFLAVLSKNSSFFKEYVPFDIFILKFKQKPVLALQDIVISFPSTNLQKLLFGNVVIDAMSTVANISTRCFFFNLISAPTNKLNVSSTFRNPEWALSEHQSSSQCTRSPITMQEFEDTFLFEATPLFLSILNTIQLQSNFSNETVAVNSYIISPDCPTNDVLTTELSSSPNGFATLPKIALYQGNHSNPLNIETQIKFLSENRYRVPMCMQVADTGSAGDGQISESLVSCFVVVVNHGPSFSTNRTLVVSEQQQSVLLLEPNFITNLRPECLGGMIDASFVNRQRFTFTIAKIEGKHLVGWKADEIFSQFEVNTTTTQHSDGTYSTYYILALRLEPFFNGDVSVFVRIEDALLTNFGGPNSSIMSFPVNVTYVNTPPVLLYAGAEIAGIFSVHLQSSGKSMVSTANTEFSLFQPIDESLTQRVSFDVLIMTNRHIFLSEPLLFPNGTLTVELSSWACGVSTWEIIVEDDASSNHTFNKYFFEVVVESVPVVQVPRILNVASDFEVKHVQYNNFVSNEGICLITASGSIFETECYTESVNLFNSNPYIDTQGNIFFSINPQRFGVADCQTRINARNLFANPNHPIGLAFDWNVFNISVQPPLSISEIRPGIVSEFLNGVITIFGENFGSSNVQEPNFTISAFVGKADFEWNPCLRTAYRSNNILLCLLENIYWGSGLIDVKVTTFQDGVTRDSSLTAGLRAARLVYGGVVNNNVCADGSAGDVCGTFGFLATGSSGYLDENNSVWIEGIDPLPIFFDSGIRSMAKVGDQLVVGGYFKSVNESKYRHIVSVDCVGPPQSCLNSFGMGVDGPVLTIVSVGDLAGSFLIGGMFARAYNVESENQGVIETGGFALWNASTSCWDLMGKAAVFGQVMAIVISNEISTTQVWIGGRFGAIGVDTAANVAKFDGSGWASVGGGVGGGEVWAMVAMNSYMFVGGSISYAGKGDLGDSTYVAAQNIAVWDGSVWSAVLDDTCIRAQSGSGSAGCGLNGPVYALAVIGEHVFAGGDFTLAGGLYAPNVARFSSGTWAALGGGVNGPVYTLAVAPPAGPEHDSSLGASCLYIAGAFSNAPENSSTATVPFPVAGSGGIAKRCFGDKQAPYTPADIMESTWQPITSPPISSVIRSILLWE